MGQALQKNDTPPKTFDPVQLSHIMMDVMERAQPIIQEAIQKYSQNPDLHDPDPMNIQDTYIEFLNAWAAHPERLVELQMEYWTNWSALWQETALRFLGEEGKPLYNPEKGDKRFKSELWNENLFFDFIKQAYLMTAQHMHKVVRSTEGLSKEEMEKLDFTTRQFADAFAPTNFILTNPDVLRETMETGGENLVRGLENLLEDLQRGGGRLKISMTDYDAFKLGQNIAITPGQVIFQNDLLQLIQYTPTTEKVFKRPLLVIPPWINKYYILDLRPENSFVKWLVDQGHTVFMMSWVNPSPDLAEKGFEDYMDEGILAALDIIEKATGKKDANVIGYCIGGTLLTMTLAYLKKKNQDKRIASATFLTTLVDFEESGELKMFTDAKSLEKLDREMAEKGLLEANHLQKTFSLLRANDLIWSFIINNYMMGKEPFPFDLLYWNDDSTNMPARMHSTYLKNMYRDNLLVQPNALEMHDTPIDITLIETPSYFLSTREDHIAPWKATYKTTQIFSGDMVFTLAASGHIAGVVNPPISKKYCFWTSAELPQNPDEWLDNAQETSGSWWTHWQSWIEKFSDGKVAARTPSKGIEPAPGSYVKVKAS